MSARVLVIGGGVNGLVTATVLAKAGRAVTLFERRASLGGLCVTGEFHPGFRANLCVDDAGWVPARVARALDLSRHGYAPMWAPAGLVLPFADGEPLALTADVAATRAAIRRHAPADADRWAAFCAQVESLSGMLAALYEVRAPMIERLGVSDALPMLSLGRRMRGLGKRGMVDFLRAVPMPVADYLEEWFGWGPLRGALSTLGVRDVQHGPMSGGTTLVYLHQHVGVSGGVAGSRRVSVGGVAALPLALAAAAREAGVTIRTGTEVMQVIGTEGAVSGVMLSDGEQVAGDIVVSSADVVRTFGTLVDPGLFDPEFLAAAGHVRMRGPGVRVHLALDALPALAGGPWNATAMGGTLTVAGEVADVEQAYDAAKHGGVAQAPMLHITLPSVGDPSLAPAGKHVMTIHAQFAAHALHGGWTAEATQRAADVVMRRAEQVAPGLSSMVVGRQVLTPSDLEREYGATGGSVLHGELALDQFLFMRPVPGCARHDTPLPGLWLCGSSTHPGAGTAGASGWLAAREILQHRR